ncbi:MAG: hypothetical protein RL441_109 [Actinomycetota bacterium]|jgi:uncharacterized YccA/Bax inhibitor family protein
MDIALKLMLILHFVGIAALLGGFVSQMSSEIKTVTKAMLHGAWTMLLTGVLMVGLVSANPDEDEPVNHMKFGVKGLVLAVIVILLMQGKNKPSVEKGTFAAIGLLSLTNIAIAVLW